MRTGDPKLASASRPWTAKNASWNQPVQRSVPITDLSAPKASTPATSGIGPISDRQQHLDGDFNTGNGGVWPRGNVKY